MFKLNHRKHLKQFSFGLYRLVIAAVLVSGVIGFRQAQAAAIDVGYKDFPYSWAYAPTGQKPQSKLWFNDGIWWGVMYNNASASKHFEIYRFNWESDTWSTTGVMVDARTKSAADVLWTGSKLYTVSNVPVGQTGDVNIYVKRFSYSALTKSYSVDNGFPVAVYDQAVETVVMDKDTAGKLWVTFTDVNGAGGRNVYVTHTTIDDNAWIAPYVIPVSGADTLKLDDISTIVAYNGNIGVMWSNQNDSTVYFAYHPDGTADNNWILNPALQSPKYADDHLNIKSLQADSSGQLFAAVKTSLNDVNPSSSSLPLVLLLTLDNNGSWSRRTVWQIVDNVTRPIVLLDEQNRDIYVFATKNYGTQIDGAIYYKSASMDNPSMQFGDGPGIPFIVSSTDTHINNVSSSKQALNSTTNLLVIAGDDTSRYYFHNKIVLGTEGPTATPTLTSSPTSSPAFTITPDPSPTSTPTLTFTPGPSPTSTPTLTFTPGPSPTSSPMATNTSLPSNTPFFVSFASSGSVGGVSFRDEDIMKFDGATWSLLFDGSDVGVGGLDLFGFSVVDADTLLMSFNSSVTINGLSITAQDIVQFDATSLGDITVGTFSMYFDGSDVGLDSNSENIDSFDQLANGHLLISTTGSPSVVGVTGDADEDILEFSPTTLGDTTSGTWAMYFDGSDVGLDTSSEDVNALNVDSNGDIYLSTLGDFSVPDITGFDEDVFVCSPITLGITTTCNYSSALFFDGSLWGLDANDVDAFEILASGTIPTATLTNTAMPTFTATSTPTNGPSPPPTNTSTPTSTFTATNTSTVTATFTATSSPTIGPSPTFTDTSTPTPTFTPTFTSSPTNTPTNTPTITPTTAVSDLIFGDSFESGNFSAWTFSSTNSDNLSVSPNAALVGSNGLQAVINNTQAMYVQDDSPNAEPRYRARFYFDPNSLVTVSGDYQYILVGFANSTNTAVLRVTFKNISGVYHLNAKILNDSTVWQSIPFVPITDEPHAIEVDWVAASAAGANDGSLTFWIDGIQQSSLTGIDNDSYRMEHVRLGLNYISATGTSGIYFFDAFESRRQTYIGP